MYAYIQVWMQTYICCIYLLYADMNECMYVFMCTQACMDVCMYIWGNYVLLYVDRYVWISVCKYVYIFVHMHACMGTCPNIHKSVNMWM